MNVRLEMPVKQFSWRNPERRRDRVTVSPLVAAAAALCMLAGCATTSLSPAPAAETMEGARDIAVSRIDGVSVTAQADAWQGDRAVTGTVQPVRVTIRNESTSALRVRYGDFALIDTDGRRYAALPPFRVEGQLMSPVIYPGYGVISPRFTFSRFHLAPYFSPLYPGIPVYAWPYHIYDPFYYDFYHRDLVAAIRPTVEMLSLALPEGVIEPGGSVSGFLYFQRVRRDVPSVVYRQDLIVVGTNGTAGANFGQISIPFTVTTSR
jgi:hypothetical protein